MPTTIDAYLQNEKIMLPRLEALQELARERPGEWTVWVGAGFGKLYADLPTWRELLTKLSNQMPGADDSALVDSLIAGNRLQIAAELLTELHSNALIEAVCDLFGTPVFAADKIPLSRHCPGTVITTNYDLILDELFDDYVLLNPRHSIESIFSFRPKLVKLHGAVNDPSSIVLNVTSYAKTYSKEFEWYLLHLFQNSTVLFVGAGLNPNEPYMRFIQLLKKAGLLSRHHYALVPFAVRATEAQTNKAITDYSNQLETAGIRVLPYVVETESDHSFVSDFFTALLPNHSASATDNWIRCVDESLDIFGPDRAGPSLFRHKMLITPEATGKRPFQNVIAKFLRAIREHRRFDLVGTWLPKIEELMSVQEEAISRMYGSDPRSSKHHEVAKNKAFLYDARRRLRIKPR